jgi:hypothetical protein
MRQKRAQWLGLVVLLAFVIVMISGYLKVARPGRAVAPPPAIASPTP